MYLCTGMHIRMTKGKKEIFRVNDQIEPTEFELVSFPDKFILVEEVEDDIVTLDTAILDGWKALLNDFIEKDEYEEVIMVEAKALFDTVCETQDEVTNLCDSIETFFEDLSDEEEVEEETTDETTEEATEEVTEVKALPNLDEMKFKELKTYVADNKIPLNGANSTVEIREEIKKFYKLV